MTVKHLTDKGSGAINEDQYLITSNLFGVFDGATGLIKYLDAKGSTGGLLAAQTARDVFEKNQKNPFINSIEETSVTIMKKMREAEIYTKDKAGLWATSASVIRVGNDSIEYIQIGDSPIVFFEKNGGLQVLEKDHDLETMQLWKLLANEGVKDVRHDDRLEKQVLKVRRESNIAYGILNGESLSLNLIRQGTISKENIKYILIFSDGMIIPQEDPNKPKDFGKIVQIFEKSGLEAVRNHIRQLEDSDPNSLTYPRFKPHDDLTAIAITL